MKITVVICCKNEEKSIASVIRQVKPYVHELLFIDGQSVDKSTIIAKKYGATVFIDNGKGKGAGVQLGIKKAHGDIIVFMDADGSHIASDIPNLVRPIIRNEADLVLASRILGGSDDVKQNFDSAIRTIGSAIITQCINWRFKTNLTDTQNGFRVIKKSVAKHLHLHENSFTIEQEMVIKALHHRYTVIEVPSHELARRYGISKIHLLSSCYHFFISLIHNLLK